jgi:transposase
MQFGQRSEKLDPDQFNLGLEDLEQAIAPAKPNRRRPIRRCAKPVRRSGGAGRGPLAEDLSRVEIVIEPEDTACPCCGGTMHVIGEIARSGSTSSPLNTR